MTDSIHDVVQPSIRFPEATAELERFGLKFSRGGPHISRTMMLAELTAVLDAVPVGSDVAEYVDAILNRNVLRKSTDSTRKESLRRLRELYALSEETPVFSVLRKLHAFDTDSLPILALQVAWARDPSFRATTQPVLDAGEGSRVGHRGVVVGLLL